jgi:hypothetical protein
MSEKPNAIKADDLETQRLETPSQSKKSVYAGLGWLDRLLALWIFLAIVIGIVLGNFVDGIEPALQRGKFVQVSVPIGELEQHSALILKNKADSFSVSCWATRYDVSYSMQSQIRNSASSILPPPDMDTAWIQYSGKLDNCPTFDGRSSRLKLYENIGY